MLKILFSVLLLMPTLLNAEPDIEKKDYTLSCHKAGSIEVGMPVENAYKIVGRENTQIIDRFREGMFDPAIEIYNNEAQFSQKPSLIAEVSPPNAQRHTSYSIGRITVYDPKYKTKEGVGVGCTLGDIKNYYKVSIGYGEGTVYAIAEGICMSFELPSKWYGVFNPDGTAGRNLIPDTEVIISVLIL